VNTTTETWLTIYREACVVMVVSLHTIILDTQLSYIYCKVTPRFGSRFYPRLLVNGCFYTGILLLILFSAFGYNDWDRTQNHFNGNRSMGALLSRVVGRLNIQWAMSNIIMAVYRRWRAGKQHTAFSVSIRSILQRKEGKGHGYYPSEAER
jgi:hypothetical protein